MNRPTPVVVLSTADYHATLWTNKQHIASRLASDRDVYYIESMGLRRPQITINDFKRVMKRLFRGRQAAVGPDSFVPVDLTIISPRILPWHSNKIVRKINQVLVRRLAKNRLPDSYVLWTFSPLTYGLELGAVRTIYHSVDLLHTLPGVPSDILLREEARLLMIADKVIASSSGVRLHLNALAPREILLWENVADVAMFESARSDDRRPRAIFVGNITPSKIHFGLLEGIAKLGLELALVGPISIDGTDAGPQLSRLLEIPGVHHLGVMDQYNMAREIGVSTVGLIPYRLNEYTAGVFPMKVYEYLAGGLQVVATQLDSLAETKINGLHTVTDDVYVATVDALLRSNYSAPKANLSMYSWDARLADVRALLDSD